MENNSTIIEVNNFYFFKEENTFGLFIDKEHYRSCYCSQCYDEETCNVDYNFQNFTIKDLKIKANSFIELFEKIIDVIHNIDNPEYATQIKLFESQENGDKYNNVTINQIKESMEYSLEYLWEKYIIPNNIEVSDKTKLQIIETYKLDNTQNLYYLINY
jgi:hypothetical protein